MLSNRFHNDTVALLDLDELQKDMVKSVTENVRKEAYKFEWLPCPVCDGNDFHPLSEKDRYGLYMPVGICKNCGLTQTNPRMNQESYNQFYNSEYRSLYVGKETAIKGFFNRQYSRGKTIFKYLKGAGAISKPLKELSVLEVGCGAGGILQYFKEQGCKVQGIDLGATYLNYGVENFGLNLKQSSLLDLNLDEKPDVIIYAHVFEHILDLNGELELIKQIAQEQTILYIEVPGLLNIHANYDMDLLSYLQNAHTYHYTKRSLQNVLQKGGFEVLMSDEFVKSISKVVGKVDEELVIDNCLEETVAYLEKMESERGNLLNRLGYLKRHTKNALVRAIKKTGIVR